MIDICLEKLASNLGKILENTFNFVEKYMRSLSGHQILYIAGLFISLTFVACKNATNQQEVAQSEEKAVTEDPINSEEEQRKTILFFGNSLTAGYMLELSEAFPAIIQNKIDSLNKNYTVVNAGLSGETTAGGLSRIDWLLKQTVDIFVLELGANDGLRGIDPGETRRNLRSIVELVRNRYPEVKIILCGMEVPPNMGPEYAASFRSIFPDLADSLNTALLPFLLDGVAGDPSLNLADGIHPTPEGHKIVAENVWAILEEML